MGTREEGTASVLVWGYSGKIRPNQAKMGACHVCKEDVYVDPDDSRRVERVSMDRVAFVHLSCEPTSARPEDLSNVIPVGGHEP